MADSNPERPQVTTHQLVVPAGQHTALRLDVYITSFIENATRNKVQEGIKAGWVLVNGKPEKASYKMQPGDTIDITIPKPPPPEATPEELPLDIVFEDEDLLILNKPAGIVVHPAFGNWTGTLVNGLLHHVQDLAEPDEDEATIRPGIVHRLDKDTSGLLVVAKKDHILKKLSDQFAEHSIERTYHAIVWGTMPALQGSIRGNIGRSRSDRKKMAVVGDNEGKPAVTHYTVLEQFDHLSYVEIRLETGRTHQIRVHFSHQRHPVLGDMTYGGNSVLYGSNTGQRKQLFSYLFERLSRQCLHAKTLGFIHPGTGKAVKFDSELPGDFKEALAKLRQFCKA